MTTRRGFLKLLSGAVAVAALPLVALRKPPPAKLALVADVNPDDVWCGRCKCYHKRQSVHDLRAEARQKLAEYWGSRMDEETEKWMSRFMGGENAPIQVITKLT